MLADHTSDEPKPHWLPDPDAPTMPLEQAIEHIRPAYNHSRADGPYDPCPDCQAARAVIEAIGRLQYEVAELTNARDGYRAAAHAADAKQRDTEQRCERLRELSERTLQGLLKMVEGEGG